MRDRGERRASDVVPLERLYLVVMATLEAEVDLLVATVMVAVVLLRGARQDAIG